MEIHGLSMLNCLITIGDEDPNDTLHILNKITVNEVVNLQIKDSYQTLINTATVEFTRQITIKSSLKDEFGTREVKLVGDKDSLFKRGKRINIKLCYGIDENLKRCSMDISLLSFLGTHSLLSVRIWGIY